MTTQPSTPTMQPSNEASAEQLDIARREGATYRQAIEAMAAEEGAAVARAGDYLVAFVSEDAEGMYAWQRDELVWREAPPEANVHLEVAVADAADGRFVPGLSVQVDLARDGQPVVSTNLPFLWHPFLYHYGGNAAVPDDGPYRATINIAPPEFMRHDPVNGKRYASPVTVRFDAVRLSTGRKPSPGARPRGPDAPTAG